MTIKLLTCHNSKNEWIGSDTEELYLHNLKSQAADWQWRNQKVSYTCNSQNYRAPEWNTIDWSNSIVVFGCSQIFGIGVSDNQTVGYYLSKLLNKSVINLGIPGGSVMALWVNTEKLLDHKVNPLAVIYNWPSANRTVELIDDQYNSPAGSWMLNRKDAKYGKEWVTHPTQGFEYAKYAVMSVRRSWQCPQLHYSWDSDTAKFLGLPGLGIDLDKARDCMHSGPKTLKSHAEQWYHKLLPTISDNKKITYNKNAYIEEIKKLKNISKEIK
jgi:hypothetical protein